MNYTALLHEYENTHNYLDRLNANWPLNPKQGLLNQRRCVIEDIRNMRDILLNMGYQETRLRNIDYLLAL